MGIKSLREASIEDIKEKKGLFLDDEIMYKRFRHVVSEIDRTIRGAEALKNQDYALFGKLMVQSHNSLRYEFSQPFPKLSARISTM